MRPTVEQWAMGVAHAVSTRGECVRRQVGCVLLDAHKRIISTGYNGAPPGEPSCLDGACPRATSGATPGTGYASTGCHAIHAEANALFEAGRARARGSTAYVTSEPCELCKPLLRGSGVQMVVWPEGRLLF